MPTIQVRGMPFGWAGTEMSRWSWRARQPDHDCPGRLEVKLLVLGRRRQAQTLAWPRGWRGSLSCLAIGYRRSGYISRRLNRRVNKGLAFRDRFRPGVIAAPYHNQSKQHTESPAFQDSYLMSTSMSG